jgi:hypothetical protein
MPVAPFRDGNQTSLGPDDPDTATAVNNLAGLANNCFIAYFFSQKRM